MATHRGPLSATGFHGMCLRPAGNYATKISAAGQRHWLGTFDLKEEAALAYDVATWRFGRPRRNQKFDDVQSLAEAEMVALKLCLHSKEEERLHHRALHRFAIAKANERVIE
ncbi:hypothetical protein ACQ4PT_069522 [Festuca glaucescens]